MSDTTPIGSIIAYAGPIDANWENQRGWLLCDGRSLNRTDAKYKDLFDSIGSSWGGDGVNQFNAPDLRGLFLRGVDGSAGRDPDKNSRTAMNPGGHAGNQAGSLQTGIYQTHSHGASATHHINGRTFSSSSRASSEWASGFAGGGAFDDGGQSGVSRNDPSISISVNEAGGSETRPINASVHWIIRYK